MSSGVEDGAEPDRAEQDRVQHAEARPSTSSGTVRWMIVIALMSTSELPSPITRDPTRATGIES